MTGRSLKDLCKPRIHMKQTVEGRALFVLSSVFAFRITVVNTTVLFLKDQNLILTLHGEL